MTLNPYNPPIKSGSVAFVSPLVIGALVAALFFPQLPVLIACVLIVCLCVAFVVSQFKAFPKDLLSYQVEYVTELSLRPAIALQKELHNGHSQPVIELIEWALEIKKLKAKPAQKAVGA